MLAFYRFFTLMLTPFIPFYLKRRIKKGKEDVNRINERYGKTNLPKIDKPLIWIHAASMGEVQSILPFIKRINQQYPNIYILLTTVTTSSAKHFAKELPEKVIHQYAPLDTILAVNKFLKHWQPQAAFFVDSELWPNMMSLLKKQKIPAILLNGRISDKSFKRWKRFNKSCKEILSAFTYVFAKSDEDARRFSELQAPDVISYGNMKFAAAKLAVDNQQKEVLLKQIDERMVWLAASTHPKEEKIIAEIHENLKTRYCDILTIIVPRHNVRGDEIRKEITQKGLNVAQRSKNENIDDSIDIYLADTMGEMGLFYSISEIAFIGGSLIPHGGQNPLEAARFSCAIIYGNYMNNFREFCHILEINKAAIMIKDKQDLQEKVEYLFQNIEEANKMADAATYIIGQNQNVLNDIILHISPILQKISESNNT